MERKLLSFRTSVIAALAALTLAGCSSLNPDIRAVKDTVIEENHSFFTVGRVLDFYPDCKDTNWDAYKDPQGHRWVHYTCATKSIDDFRTNALKTLSDKRKPNDPFRIKAEKALGYSDAELLIKFRLLGVSDKWKINSTSLELTWPDGATRSVSLPVYLVLAAMKKGEPIKPEEVNERLGFISRMFGSLMESVELHFIMSAYDDAHSAKNFHPKK